MALNIKHPEADNLARELARLTGLSLTESVIKALREQVRRESGRNLASSLGEEVRRIGDRCAALPDIDKRSAEEILGFNEFGIPQ